MKDILDGTTRIFRKYFTDDCVDTFFVAHNLACERKYIGKEYELHGSKADADFFQKIVKEYGFCTMVPASAKVFYGTEIPVDIKFRQNQETTYVQLKPAYERMAARCYAAGRMSNGTMQRQMPRR